MIINNMCRDFVQYIFVQGSGATGNINLEKLQYTIWPDVSLYILVILLSSHAKAMTHVPSGLMRCNIPIGYKYGQWPSHISLCELV